MDEVVRIRTEIDEVKAKIKAEEGNAAPDKAYLTSLNNTLAALINAQGRLNQPDENSVLVLTNEINGLKKKSKEEMEKLERELNKYKDAESRILTRIEQLENVSDLDRKVARFGYLSFAVTSVLALTTSVYQNPPLIITTLSRRLVDVEFHLSRIKLAYDEL